MIISNLKSSEIVGNAKENCSIWSSLYKFLLIFPMRMIKMSFMYEFV